MKAMTENDYGSSLAERGPLKIKTEYFQTTYNIHFFFFFYINIAEGNKYIKSI